MGENVLFDYFFIFCFFIRCSFAKKLNKLTLIAYIRNDVIYKFFIIYIYLKSLEINLTKYGNSNNSSYEHNNKKNLNNKQKKSLKILYEIKLNCEKCDVCTLFLNSRRYVRNFFYFIFLLFFNIKKIYIYL